MIKTICVCFNPFQPDTPQSPEYPHAWAFWEICDTPRTSRVKNLITLLKFEIIGHTAYQNVDKCSSYTARQTVVYSKVGNILVLLVEHEKFWKKVKMNYNFSTSKWFYCMKGHLELCMSGKNCAAIIAKQNAENWMIISFPEQKPAVWPASELGSLVLMFFNPRKMSEGTTWQTSYCLGQPL